jgi:hypothetical protein
MNPKILKKSTSKKNIATSKREAKAAKQLADFEKTKAGLSPQNRQHVEKVIAATPGEKLINLNTDMYFSVIDLNVGTEYMRLKFQILC